MSAEHVDVLIVGAGLSGIGAAVHLQRDCPDRSFLLLEARAATGGTWDLFRYPGIRSDSDMHTLGYAFRPWTAPQAIADGPSILRYVRDTAREHAVDARIRLQHRVLRANWSGTDKRWTVDCLRGPDAEPASFTCRFLLGCSGYYDHEAGYTPAWPGRERFAGTVLHPQHWPEGLDTAGKRIVVIGSGATAMTLVPALAATAAHVTMLQRSPTYVVALPGRDVIANGLRKLMPARAAYALTRWKNVLLGLAFYQWCRRWPAAASRVIVKGVQRALGPGFDVARHFTPRYAPWDQRLCIVPDGDLFQALRAGRASVVTDEIETFTETGLRLRSGTELPADVIVTATGLVLKLFGGIALSVDGRPVDFSRSVGYRGSMLSEVPNFALVMGYTNASWTLKADLTCNYVCRVLNHLAAQGYAQCTPRLRDAAMATLPWLDFSSGYVQRALALLPKQGARTPWRLHQNYLRDLFMLRRGRLEDGVLEFER